MFCKYTVIQIVLILITYIRLSSLITVPPKGTSEGWDERNIQLGKSWASLSKDEKDVFSARIFQHFSKIPCIFEDDEDLTEDEEESRVTPEEEEIYSPLYKKLVNDEKVKALLENESENPGQKCSQEPKKALKNILKLNSEVSSFSNYKI